MKKKIIAVDADDTIFDENTAIRLFVNKNYGFHHTEEDYLVEGPFDNYWENIWKVDLKKMDEMYEEFVISEEKKSLQPIPGALEVLGKLKGQYELVVVTSRDRRAVEFTHKSLKSYYPEIFSNVHFVPLWGDGEKMTKAKICNEIGASYLIDDNFEHCSLAAGADVSAILFGDYGWNKYQDLPPKITRCKNWQEIWDKLSY